MSGYCAPVHNRSTSHTQNLTIREKLLQLKTSTSHDSSSKLIKSFNLQKRGVKLIPAESFFFFNEPTNQKPPKQPPPESH